MRKAVRTASRARAFTNFVSCRPRNSRPVTTPAKSHFTKRTPFSASRVKFSRSHACAPGCDTSSAYTGQNGAQNQL